jgi:hypothetical protein
LKGAISNISYSKEQLIDEAFQVRNSLIMKYSMQGKFDLDSLYQTFDSLPIHEIDLSNNHTEIRSGLCRNYILLPKPSVTFDKVAIEYIGDVTKGNAFKVYYNANFKTHQHKFKISRKPYVYLDTSIRPDGRVIAYVYNIGEIKDFRYMTVKMIAENPTEFMSTVDCCTDAMDMEFPAPGWMQKEILDAVVNTYVTQYRRMNIPDISLSNKQRDINA